MRRGWNNNAYPASPGATALDEDVLIDYELALAAYVSEPRG